MADLDDAKRFANTAYRPIYEQLVRQRDSRLANASARNAAHGSVLSSGMVAEAAGIFADTVHDALRAKAAATLEGVELHDIPIDDVSSSILQELEQMKHDLVRTSRDDLEGLPYLQALGMGAYLGGELDRAGSRALDEIRTDVERKRLREKQAATSRSAEEMYRLANRDAERMILGAILLDNSALAEASALVNSRDFSEDSHRRIFQRATEVAMSGKAVDIVTLSNELARHKEVSIIGGVAYLASLTENLPRRPEITKCSQLVKDLSLLRRLAVTIAEGGLPEGWREGIGRLIADSPEASITTPVESDAVHNRERWDVFISHATEDKDAIARPLAEALLDQNLRVWFDEFSLTVGDSLRESIDKGLAQCRFGIVVLSKQFFEKHWPQRELNGLAVREVNGEKVILPVWHGVEAAQVREYSPMLADRVAARTEMGLKLVVDQLMRVILVDSD